MADLEALTVARKPGARRFPWMTAEDVEVINALDEGDADSFEALIHAQARAAARDRAHTYLECQLRDLGIGAAEGLAPLEAVAGFRDAKFAYGPGGGRRRHQEFVFDD
jgi:hypothetical protein